MPLIKLSFLVTILFAVLFSCRMKDPEVDSLKIVFTSEKGFDWRMKRNSELQKNLSEVSSKSYKDENWQLAIVPGTVLNSLVANGIFPGPYYGLNNEITNDSIPDISEEGRDLSLYFQNWICQEREQHQEKLIRHN